MCEAQVWFQLDIGAKAGAKQPSTKLSQAEADGPHLSHEHVLHDQLAVGHHHGDGAEERLERLRQLCSRVSDDVKGSACACCTLWDDVQRGPYSA
jgi:hypothetical protein